MEDLNVEMESEEPSPQAAGPILTISDTCGSSLKLGIAKLDGNLKSSMEHGQICLRRSPILVNPAVKVGHPTFPQIIPGLAFTLLRNSRASSVVVLYLGQQQVAVISNHILQGAPSQCGQGRRRASHLDESRIARRWNGTSVVLLERS